MILHGLGVEAIPVGKPGRALGIERWRSLQQLVILETIWYYSYLGSPTVLEDLLAGVGELGLVVLVGQNEVGGFGGSWSYGYLSNSSERRNSVVLSHANTETLRTKS